ncbi:MAG: hypothetical protein QM750_11695 [Rubrivivax sp.]
MADRTKQAPQTAEQLAMVFGDIAESARAIERFAIGQLDDEHDDERDIEARRVAVETLAERIGLLADWAGASLRSVLVLKGSELQDWLMPPAWHDQQAKREGAEE